MTSEERRRLRIEFAKKEHDRKQILRELLAGKSEMDIEWRRSK